MKTCQKKRVGFMIQGAPARHGAKIYSNGEEVGEITSGTLSPSLKKPVAMGYITSTGKCYARNGGDYMAQMIDMAGGQYILADMEPEKSGERERLARITACVASLV